MTDITCTYEYPPTLRSLSPSLTQKHTHTLNSQKCTQNDLVHTHVCTYRHTQTHARTQAHTELVLWAPCSSREPGPEWHSGVRMCNDSEHRQSTCRMLLPRPNKPFHTTQWAVHTTHYISYLHLYVLHTAHYAHCLHLYILKTTHYTTYLHLYVLHAVLGDVCFHNNRWILLF